MHSSKRITVGDPVAANSPLLEFLTLLLVKLRLAFTRASSQLTTDKYRATSYSH